MKLIPVLLASGLEIRGKLSPKRIRQKNGREKEKEEESKKEKKKEKERERETERHRQRERKNFFLNQ